MTEEARRRFGAKVRAERELLGLTQIQLADRADVEQRTVSLIERGKLNLSFDTLLKIAAALGKNASDLLDS